MPEPKTAARRPRTVERRVAFLSVQFFSDELTPDGSRRETVRSATRGQLITLPVTEASRLDALGALAPEGATVQDIEDDLAAAYAAYQAARQTVPDTA